MMWKEILNLYFLLWYFFTDLIKSAFKSLNQENSIDKTQFKILVNQKLIPT